MQKILFGIFAHPDDEAFGPVAALLDEVEKGTELHLITLTGGENGTNPDNLDNLGEVRLQALEVVVVVVYRPRKLMDVRGRLCGKLCCQQEKAEYCPRFHSPDCEMGYQKFT